jgi:ectoine hydroxylase-related dioxygenase (phytanoyl-CoA dioxygenase family)
MSAVLAEATQARDYAKEFADNGFTVIKGFFTKEETGQLLAEVQRCAKEDESRTVGLTDIGIVYTGNIFHRSESTRKLLTHQRVIDFLNPIAGTDLWVRMDQAVTKNPGAGVFRWHQDNGYNQLKTVHYQLWIALTETRKANGALTLAPGSHKRGLLPHKYIANGQVEVQAPVGETVVVNADRGDLILFSSLMLHCTGPNEADNARVAYVAEYMPLSDYDYEVPPPYFVASQGGKSAPHYIDKQPGASSIGNQLMYAKPRAVKSIKKVLRPVRDALRSK